MAEIILAEFAGTTWVVAGEEFIDDLLMNTLAAEIGIEFVTCELQSDVRRLWIAHTGEREGWDAPFMIHPAIAKRARGAIGATGIEFAAWSVLLDPVATETIAGFVQALQADPAASMALHYQLPAGTPPGSAELAALRCSLIEGELATRGIPASRVTRKLTQQDDPAAAKPDRISLELTRGNLAP